MNIMPRCLLLCLCVSIELSSGLGAPPRTVGSTPPMSSLVRSSDHSDHGGTIESKYDGFNHEMVVTLKRMRVTCSGGKGFGTTLKDTCISFEVALHCPGAQLDYVKYVNLQVVFDTKDLDQRHPLDKRDLTVVAGTQALRMGQMALLKQSVDSDRMADVMREILETRMSYDTFKKIAMADAVEMKVGDDTFALRDKNIAALRDLNNRIKP